MLSPKICNSGVRPVALGGLGLGERVGRLETGGHGGAGSRHDLVVVEVQQLVVLALLEPRLPAALGALVAAVLALDAVRDVDAAELLDGVVDDALAEQVLPGVGERPEGGRHVRANRGALRSRRALTRAALHLGAHVGGHPLPRDVADALGSGHDALPPRDSYKTLSQRASRTTPARRSTAVSSSASVRWLNDSRIVLRP